MKIKPEKTVHSPLLISSSWLDINSKYEKSPDREIALSNYFAYPPLINSHDHLIGNWYPKAGENAPYATTDIWVEEMKESPPYLERNRIWINDGEFKLNHGNAMLLADLGIYKNIFSGCSVVQDHAPNQEDEYYRHFPIQVVRNYRQCHSISLGNWWGGKTAREEWLATGMNMPFILHLAEGTNEKARTAFSRFEKEGLLQANSLIIHGIALTAREIKKCAEAGTSICCCPESNFFLIGETIDIKTCLEYGVNLVIGTDSTMSGSLNLLEEIRVFHQHFPDVPLADVFSFITVNARKALFLSDNFGELKERTSELLLIRKKHADPFENLLQAEPEDIALLLHHGMPVYGDEELVNLFHISEDTYSVIDLPHCHKTIIGDPQDLNRKIDSILGYHKELPYLPFS